MQDPLRAAAFPIADVVTRRSAHEARPGGVIRHHARGTLLATATDDDERSPARLLRDAGDARAWRRLIRLGSSPSALRREKVIGPRRRIREGVRGLLYLSVRRG